jgi:hypothetical protein
MLQRLMSKKQLSITAARCIIMERNITTIYYIQQSFCSELIAPRLVNKLPVIYVSRELITLFTKARHYFLTSPKWTQCTPSHINHLKSILIISFDLFLRLPSSFLRSGFPTKFSYAFLICTMRATCPVHLILLNLITSKILVRIQKFPDWVDK